MIECLLYAGRCPGTGDIPVNETDTDPCLLKEVINSVRLSESAL